MTTRSAGFQAFHQHPKTWALQQLKKQRGGKKEKKVYLLEQEALSLQLLYNVSCGSRESL